jgi:hypothetical protein
MNLSKICLVVAMLSVGAAPVSGAPPLATRTHGPGAHSTGSRPTTQTTHGTPHTPTTHRGSKTVTATHGNPKTVATTHGSAKTPTKAHGTPHKTAATAPTATGSTSGTAPTSGTTAPTAPTLNPIAQKISSNHGLQPKVNGLLPTGMTLNQASLGFKNQGQFIAALHVSRNLGIPFADLKTAMTGIRPTTTTGTPGGTTTGTTVGTTGTSTLTSQPTLSLGQAIKKLRPSANAASATTTAEHQATIDATAAKKASK